MCHPLLAFITLQVAAFPLQDLWALLSFGGAMQSRGARDVRKDLPPFKVFTKEISE